MNTNGNRREKKWKKKKLIDIGIMLNLTKINLTWIYYVLYN